jgi:hypothetical protein
MNFNYVGLAKKFIKNLNANDKHINQDINEENNLKKEKVNKFVRNLEKKLRKLFIVKDSSSMIQDCHVTLFSIYNNFDIFCKTNNTSFSNSFDEFIDRFNKITQYQLSDVNWENIVVTGDTILSSIDNTINITDNATKSIDLYIYGLSEEDATNKIMNIYELFKTKNPIEPKCIRSPSSICITSGYPFREIRIKTILFKSVAQILMSFDIDSECMAFDGKNVWCSPRGHQSLVNKENVIDPEYLLSGYEKRFIKYYNYGYLIKIPNFEMSRLNICDLLKVSVCSETNIFDKHDDECNDICSNLEIDKLSNLLCQTIFNFKRNSIEHIQLVNNVKKLKMINVSNNNYHHNNNNNDCVTKSNKHMFPTINFNLPLSEIEDVIYCNDKRLNENIEYPSPPIHPYFIGTMEDILNNSSIEKYDLNLILSQKESLDYLNDNVHGNLKWHKCQNNLIDQHLFYAALDNIQYQRCNNISCKALGEINDGNEINDINNDIGVSGNIIECIKYAIENKNINTFKYLINNCGKPHQLITDDGGGIYHMLVKQQDVKFFKECNEFLGNLDSFIDPNKLDIYGSHPIFYTIIMNNFELFKFICTLPIIKKNVKWKLNNTNVGIFHICWLVGGYHFMVHLAKLGYDYEELCGDYYLLFDIIKFGSLDELKLFINMGHRRNIYSIIDGKLSTLLSEAISRYNKNKNDDNKQIIKFMLDNNFIINSTYDEYKYFIEEISNDKRNIIDTNYLKSSTTLTNEKFNQSIKKPYYVIMENPDYWLIQTFSKKFPDFVNYQYYKNDPGHKTITLLDRVTNLNNDYPFADKIHAYLVDNGAKMIKEMNGFEKSKIKEFQSLIVNKIENMDENVILEECNIEVRLENIKFLDNEKIKNVVKNVIYTKNIESYNKLVAISNEFYTLQKILADINYYIIEIGMIDFLYLNFENGLITNDLVKYGLKISKNCNDVHNLVHMKYIKHAVKYGQYTILYWLLHDGNKYFKFKYQHNEDTKSINLLHFLNPVELPNKLNLNNYVLTIHLLINMGYNINDTNSFNYIKNIASSIELMDIFLSKGLNPNNVMDVIFYNNFNETTTIELVKLVMRYDKYNKKKHTNSLLVNEVSKKHKNYNVIKFLLELGVDLLYKDDKGFSFMHLIIGLRRDMINLDLKIILMFIEKGIKLSKNYLGLTEFDYLKRSLLLNIFEHDNENRFNNIRNIIKCMRMINNLKSAENNLNIVNCVENTHIIMALKNV